MADHEDYHWIAEDIQDVLEEPIEEPADAEPWEEFIEDEDPSEDEEDPIEWIWDDEEELSMDEVDCEGAPPLEVSDDEVEIPQDVVAVSDDEVEIPQDVVAVSDDEVEIPHEMVVVPQEEVEPREELEEGGDTSEEEEFLSELEDDGEEDPMMDDPEMEARVARFDAHEEFHRGNYLTKKRKREDGCIGGWLACEDCGELEHGVDGCTNPPREKEEATPRKEWYKGMKAPRRMTITIGGPGPEASRVYMHARDVQDAIRKLSSMETVPWWRPRGN